MRLHNPAEIDNAQVLEATKNGRFVTIQFCGITYNDDLLYQINDLCKQSSSNLEIRFYNSQDEVLDAEIFQKIRHVKNLNVGKFSKVVNITVLKQLTYLERLFLETREVDDKSFWGFTNLKALKIITLNITKSTFAFFQFLKSYDCLETLTLLGNPHSLQAVGEAKNLKRLHLWHLPKSCTLNDLNNLPFLKELELTLGGRESIDELEGKTFETIRLNQVKGFKGFADLSKFTNLQKLSLMDLAQINKLDFPVLPMLKKLTILNCKQLEQLNHISNLKALETLLVDRVAINFEDFMKLSFPINLKTLGFYTNKVRKDKEIEQYLRSLGYRTI